MLAEGVRLMVVGMLTVFAFLTLLVGVMKASAAFFSAFEAHFPEDEPEASRGRGAVTGRAGGDEEIALVLAIAEAKRTGQRV